MVVTTNATELLRRFADWGVSGGLPKPQYALFWLIDEVRNGVVSGDASQNKFDEIVACLVSGAPHQYRAIDGMSGNLANLYEEDLLHARDKGKLPPASAGNRESFIRAMISNMEGDVQGVESYNSILRIITNRCRHIDRDLVDVRHVIQHSECVERLLHVRNIEAAYQYGARL